MANDHTVSIGDVPVHGDVVVIAAPGARTRRDTEGVVTLVVHPALPFSNLWSNPRRVAVFNSGDQRGTVRSSDASTDAHRVLAVFHVGWDLGLDRDVARVNADRNIAAPSRTGHEIIYGGKHGAVAIVHVSVHQEEDGFSFVLAVCAVGRTVVHEGKVQVCRVVIAVEIA